MATIFLLNKMVTPIETTSLFNYFKGLVVDKYSCRCVRLSLGLFFTFGAVGNYFVSSSSSSPASCRRRIVIVLAMLMAR